MAEPEVMVPGLNETESMALEALFAQDLPGAPLAKIKRKIGAKLTGKGFAEPATVTFGTGPLEFRAFNKKRTKLYVFECRADSRSKSIPILRDPL